MNTRVLFPVLVALATAPCLADANRLAYLDENNPYYASHRFPKLTTEQWLQDPKTKAVVVLAVDDLMENSAAFEAFLRPIIERLKKSYGTAPISIMSNRVKPDDPIVARWLQEGLNLETHTHTHPCPFFDNSDFQAANWTYHTCVDNLSEIPGNRPVAFRMPCLDIWNTTSPRFYTEIFNKTSPKGRFLTMSSSITVVFNGSDPELPRSIVFDEAGRERFGKYMNQKDTDVFGRVNYQYGNYIENYPYPMVVAGLCWEIPMVTSDNTMAIYWGRYGNHTLRDWKAAVEATLLKQGILALCFHITGNSKPEEFVKLVDEFERKYPGAVKFMNFRQVQEALDQNLLAGHPLRAPDGGDNGVRVLDLNADGYLDVVIGNERAQVTRVWDRDRRAFREFPFPTRIVVKNSSGEGRDGGVRFGVLQTNGFASFLVTNENAAGLWHFTGDGWIQDEHGLTGLPDGFFTSRAGLDQGVRFRDLDGNGVCELISSDPERSAIYRRTDREWVPAALSLPETVSIVDRAGRDRGLRFVDLNGDGKLNLVFSNEERAVVAWLESLGRDWSAIIDHPRQSGGWQLPMISRNGQNNGAWFDRERMWVVNEDTSNRRDHAEVVSFAEINEAREFRAGLIHFTEWLVAGPFNNEENGFHTVFEPEISPGSIQPSAKFVVLDGREQGWRRATAVPYGSSYGFSLERFCEQEQFRKNGLIVYLYTVVESPQPQKAKLWLGSEDSVKVWLNGRLVHQKFVRRKASPGKDRIILELRQGPNPMLIKLEQSNGGGWLLASLALPKSPVTLAHFGEEPSPPAQ